MQGMFADVESIRRAMKGVYGVFSVQPSSPGGEVSDEDEVRFGVAIADIALESGVKHLVYTSGAGVGDTPTGMGHYDSKGRIEAHIRTVPITATLARPSCGRMRSAMSSPERIFTRDTSDGPTVRGNVRT